MHFGGDMRFGRNCLGYDCHGSNEQASQAAPHVGVTTGTLDEAGVEWREANFPSNPRSWKNGTHAFGTTARVSLQKRAVGTMTGAGPRWAAFESTWPRRPGELADVLASALKPHGDAELLLVALAFAAPPANRAIAPRGCVVLASSIDEAVVPAADEADAAQVDMFAFVSSERFVKSCGEGVRDKLRYWLKNSLVSKSRRILFARRLKLRHFDEYVNSLCEQQNSALKSTNTGARAAFQLRTSVARMNARAMAREKAKDATSNRGQYLYIF